MRRLCKRWEELGYFSERKLQTATLEKSTYLITQEEYLQNSFRAWMRNRLLKERPHRGSCMRLQCSKRRRIGGIARRAVSSLTELLTSSLSLETEGASTKGELIIIPWQNLTRMKQRPLLRRSKRLCKAGNLSQVGLLMKNSEIQTQLIQI